MASSDARSTLRSILDAEVLAPTCGIDVVFSKWDLIVSAAKEAELLEYVARIREAFKSLVRARAAVEFYEVAARPESKSLPFAHGLPTLLRGWMSETNSQEQTNFYLRKDTKDDREIMRSVRRISLTPGLKAAFDVHWV